MRRRRSASSASSWSAAGDFAAVGPGDLLQTGIPLDQSEQVDMRRIHHHEGSFSSDQPETFVLLSFCPLAHQGGLGRSKSVINVYHSLYYNYIYINRIKYFMTGLSWNCAWAIGQKDKRTKAQTLHAF
jgi:hypothetical protein